jgi:hypothetical protein
MYLAKPATQAALSFGGPGPDVNDDGKSDIAFRSDAGDVAIWENVSGGTHGGQALGNVGQIGRYKAPVASTETEKPICYGGPRAVTLLPGIT